jgi:hypothetical protein
VHPHRIEAARGRAHEQREPIGDRRRIRDVGDRDAHALVSGGARIVRQLVVPADEHQLAPADEAAAVRIEAAGHALRDPVGDRLVAALPHPRVAQPRRIPRHARHLRRGAIQIRRDVGHRHARERRGIPVDARVERHALRVVDRERERATIDRAEAAAHDQIARSHRARDGGGTRVRSRCIDHNGVGIERRVSRPGRGAAAADHCHCDEETNHGNPSVDWE